MDHIVEPNESFIFSQLSLAPPIGIQGGSYFTKLFHNNNPLYIQIPKCQTKQGIIQSGRKMYCDLKFTQNDAEFIQWLENLETNVQNLIFAKSNSWFHNNISKDDIESAFTSPIKIFKSGKYYIVRCTLPFNHLTSNPNIKIFNESEEPVSYKDINTESSMISILEISGVRFTTKNFQIDINVKQIMILKNDPAFTSCLIKRTHSNAIETKDESLVEISNEPDQELSNTLEENADSSILLITPEIDADEQIDEDVKQIDDDDHTATVSEEDDDDEDEDEDDDEDEDINVAKPKLVLSDDSISLNDMTTNTIDDYIKNISLSEIKNNDIKEALDNSKNKVVNELSLQEFDINLAETSNDNIKLKSHDEVYYGLYQAARTKAKLARKAAIEAYLEVNNIKNLYMLDEIDSDEEEEFNEILEPTENTSSLA